MGREAKFNPIPESQLIKGTVENLSVTFNVKTRFLSFNLRSLGAEELIGRYVKFYVDTQKNTLLWKMLDKEHSLTDLKDYHQIKEVIMGEQKQRSIKVYIPAAVYHALKFAPGKKFQKMDVGIYKPGGYLEQGDYFYITF